ncbi:MAG: hypothetical protein CL674_14445 [Bdellovibrionaceae bacterium]|jgi:hypothetical protein|nr:hypothetical protein [Pseudobdellovibrionaceae bacterium]MAF92466.1 hypothetical protein [Pseudobdellovibrionaceae bacterium]QDP47558.1 MAG: hypothetical protein GOVbin1174_6 [Prokaryotic dsDNA virus sp.]|tara:strand:+ start:12018 stop:12989 length:972 start_codon:yes stop_codon:yes gene_type:complete
MSIEVVTQESVMEAPLGNENVTEEATESKETQEAEGSEEQETASESAPLDEETEKTEGEEDSEEEIEEDDSEEEDEPEVEEKKAHNKGAVKRINKLTSKLYEKDETIESLKAELEALRNNSKLEEKVEAKPQAENQAPNPDDFEEYQDYLDAHADWRYDMRRAEEKAKEEQEAKQKAFLDRRNEFSNKLGDFGKDKEDFSDLVDKMAKENVIVPVYVEDMIMSSDNGPAILYHFMKNEDARNNVFNKTPLDAAFAVGALSAKLSQSQEKPKEVIEKKQTKAPAPAKPVSGKNASVKKDIYDNSTSQTEYERLREEQWKAKARF